ncbi:MAG: GNAT family N-acetyltransferase [Roseiflexaceae bacterium]
MIIRVAREADAPAMGRVMVDTHLAAHRDQMPAEAWAKRAQEWTYEESAQGWARTLREIAAGAGDCIYLAEDMQGNIVGLVMGGPIGEPADADTRPQSGAIDALYVQASHQGRGLGRQLLQAVAIHLAQHGISALQIGCLATNAPARRFYEALGGQLIDERLFNEEGIMLPEVVYGWANIEQLITQKALGQKQDIDD